MLTVLYCIDVLRMVLGNTKWALDFSFYVLNELFDLADDFESLSGDQEAFTQKCSWGLASTYLVNHANPHFRQ